MRNRNIGLWGLLVALSVCALPCHARITKLAPQDRKHLLSDNFRIVTRTAQIPAAVRAEFCRRTHAPSFQMADPGQTFQVTDVIVRPGLPGRRLIFAGVSGDRCLLFYERGGIAHTYTLLLFRLSGAKADWHWSAVPQTYPVPTTLPALQASLQTGKWDDTAGLFW